MKNDESPHWWPSHWCKGTSRETQTAQHTSDNRCYSKATTQGCGMMLQKQPYFSASAITFSLAIINLLRSALVMCFHGKVTGIPASSRGETGSMLGSGERWLVEGSDFLESLVSLSLTFASLNLSLSRLFCSWDSALRRRSLRILSVESSCFFLRS